MLRTRIAWPLLALIVLTAGCAMCAHPFDYCGPTFTGECGQTCDPMARAGSRLSPPLEPMLDETPATNKAAAGKEEKSPTAAATEEQPQATKESTGEPAPESLPEPEAKPAVDREARSPINARPPRGGDLKSPSSAAPGSATAPNRWTARPSRAVR